MPGGKGRRQAAEMGEEPTDVEKSGLDWWVFPPSWDERSQIWVGEVRARSRMPLPSQSSTKVGVDVEVEAGMETGTWPRIRGGVLGGWESWDSEGEATMEPFARRNTRSGF